MLVAPTFVSRILRQNPNCRAHSKLHLTLLLHLTVLQVAVAASDRHSSPAAVSHKACSFRLPDSARPVLLRPQHVFKAAGAAGAAEGSDGEAALKSVCNSTVARILCRLLYS